MILTPGWIIQLKHLPEKPNHNREIPQMKNSFAIVTSISPKNPSFQVDAMGSWTELGYPLYSFNSVEEREILEKQIPIPIINVGRTAKEQFKKPLIFIDSFLEYFRNDPTLTHLIIVNSDIFLSDPNRFKQIINSVEFDLIFGRRLDVDSLESTAGELFDGFDYFVLSKQAAALYPASKFCMGAPWWDHWMPLIQLAHGKRTYMCEEPIALHLKHEMKWGLDTQIPLAKDLGDYMLQIFDKKRSEAGTDITKNPLLGLSSLFAIYFKLEREYHNFHYYRGGQYQEETQRALSHEICWRMPQVVLQYIFSVTPRVGKDIVGHDKPVPLEFK